MILIDKTVFENNVYLNTNGEINILKLKDWYGDIMINKVKFKYLNLIKSMTTNVNKLNDEDKVYICNTIIPFFKNEDKIIDIDLINILLSNDFIGELDKFSKVPPKAIDEINWIKIMGYYLISKFVFYDLEKIKYNILKQAENDNLSQEECIIIIESLYNKKVSEYNLINIKLNIEPKVIKVSKVSFKQWNKKNREKFIKDNINAIAKTVGIKLEIENTFYGQSKVEVSRLEDIKKFNKMLSLIINYDDLADKHRHLILKTLDVSVCPYCNRQYITSYEPSKRKKNNIDMIATADLDHFYPKAGFQLFSLSLYNFVPSCQICNSRMKLDKPIEILYPYNDFFNEEVRFEVVPKYKNEEGKKLLDLLYGKNDILKNDKYKIIINTSNVKDSKRRQQIDGSIEMFQLEQVYQSHKTLAAEVIRTQAIYENDIYNYITDMLFSSELSNSKKRKNTLESVISHVDESSREQLAINEKNRILYGLNVKDENQDLKQPLGKFLRDILKLE